MIDKAIALLKIVKEHLENNKPMCPFPQRDIIYSVFLNKGALKDEFISAFPIEKASEYHRVLLVMGMADSSSGRVPNDEVCSTMRGKYRRDVLIRYINEILNELETSTHKKNMSGLKMIENGNYDIFISHASEDKNAVARPLARQLLKDGYNVFLDELVIKLGDSITESINQGLSQAKYCVLIISSTFLEKNWTKAELSSITNMFISSDKMILPIWHGVTYEDIKNHAPLLLDLRAANSSTGIDSLVAEIEKAIGSPDKKHSLKTNYLWNFYDFSEAVQVNILKNMVEVLTDIDLRYYHTALEEGLLYLDSLRNFELTQTVVEVLEKTYAEFESLLFADEQDLINDR